MIRYLLDANVFIQAKNQHYGLDFCPAFWDWLIYANTKGVIYSIEKVKEELTVGDDELATWAKSLNEEFFLPIDYSTTQAMREVSRWVDQNYEMGAESNFFETADYYLISYALAHRFTIVTHEKFTTSTIKIKIPNVCRELNIPCLSPFEMLRRQKVRFILQPPNGLNTPSH